jgi:hypothetical protein
LWVHLKEHAGASASFASAAARRRWRQARRPPTLSALRLIHPDAFLPDLATSLDNLGVDLSNLGRGEEALAACQEAADIRRHLAESRPDAFLPNLAMSLNNLVPRHSDFDSLAESFG